MWKNYHILNSIDELIEQLSKKAENCKIISGGTDLMVEIRNGKWPALDIVLDISRIAELDYIRQSEDGLIHIGAGITHNRVLQSPLLRASAWPLYQACYHVASPQIRNRATVIGNLATASPANDSIAPLMAMDASLLLLSTRGERVVALNDYYRGVRRTVIEADEFIKEVFFRPLQAHQHGAFKKQGLRKAQAISVLNCAVLLDMAKDGSIAKASVTLGSLAPTVVHAKTVEGFLQGKSLSPDLARQAGNLASADVRPIGDIRSSAEYRSYMVQVLVEQALLEIFDPNKREQIPEMPITLCHADSYTRIEPGDWDNDLIVTELNGEEHQLRGYSDNSLANLLRERVGLTGTKLGCEEGECGACTVHMDGRAVVSCLIPAPRAHRAKITTIEGLADGDKLHPVQQAFIDHAAIQCGYCSPGFILSAVKMLEEKPNPSMDDIKTGISGNLCRCTGYYKIIEAIESVCQDSHESNR